MNSQRTTWICYKSNLNAHTRVLIYWKAHRLECPSSIHAMLGAPEEGTWEASAVSPRLQATAFAMCKSNFKWLYTIVYPNLKGSFQFAKPYKSLITGRVDRFRSRTLTSTQITGVVFPEKRKLSFAQEVCGYTCKPYGLSPAYVSKPRRACFSKPSSSPRLGQIDPMI